ncbi:MAG: exodeoxyribonuclease VII large subunit, partial [Rhodospirillales bacterium]
LAEEGLFDPDRKKPLPFLPDVIGVVTSPTGAVIRDILHRLADRFPRRVLLWPVTVQGEGAAEAIASAIQGFNRLKPKGKVPRPDLLIVARGGGSLEDLWAFNEENVVRAAAASRIPLISAVGHETDITLIDFAADARAPTPTAAAEMAVPVRADLVAAVEEEGARLVAAGGRLIEDGRTRLDGLARGLPDLGRLAEELGQRLDDWTERLKNTVVVGMDRRRAELTQLAAELPRPKQQFDHAKRQLSRETRALVTARDAVLREARQAIRQVAALLESASYARVLERGFVLVADAGRRPVVSVAGLAPGMEVGLRFHDGEAQATVESVKGGGRPGGSKRRPRTPKPGSGDRQGRLL